MIHKDLTTMLMSPPDPSLIPMSNLPQLTRRLHLRCRHCLKIIFYFHNVQLLNFPDHGPSSHTIKLTPPLDSAFLSHQFWLGTWPLYILLPRKIFWKIFFKYKMNSPQPVRMPGTRAWTLFLYRKNKMQLAATFISLYTDTIYDVKIKY